MIRTLKASIGLGLLAALAMSAMSVLSASANISGHFTSTSANNTILNITEVTGTTHVVKLHALGNTVECHKPTYTGSFSGPTTQSLTVKATYENCTSGSDPATVTMNGCDYVFHSGGNPHATTSFVCPSGVKAEVHTPNGTFKFGTQTPTKGGATYTTDTTPGGKHALTVDVTAEGIHYECHGFCALFGTKGTNATMTGQVTVNGVDNAGSPVDITAT